MSTQEVEMLRSFLQREIDVLRNDLKESRDEAAKDHKEVKHQLAAVRKDIAALSGRVSEVEAHEETIEHADEARQEAKTNMRNTILAGNAIVGTIIVIVIFLADHWKP